jgi:hypothetical protein
LFWVFYHGFGQEEWRFFSAPVFSGFCLVQQKGARSGRKVDGGGGSGKEDETLKDELRITEA